tara:strand:+ start:262 stop:477 length:216 start_codon:yes stop_codon:yes gene_type:complete
MTKAIKPVTEAVEETRTDLASDPSPVRDYWKRECALDKAIQFHKTNGGMMHPMQLVDHANIFLSFLQGENK